MDDDVVEESNLQRQVIHRSHEVGLSKVESAARFARELNPNLNIQYYAEKLNEVNVQSHISSFDIVVDGTDNFKSRFLINDTCVALGKPHIHGAIFKFQGEVTVFNPKAEGSPCYRCLFPEPPPPELAPSCSEAGVLGVLPGIIGTLQAHETLKLILGLGEGLTGRLLQFHGLRSEFREIEIQKDPSCKC